MTKNDIAVTVSGEQSEEGRRQAASGKPKFMMHSEILC